jgi:putative solute:sodium symporter small subunit|tara:strand:+ start:4555 stop:4830 length:276 start_codon:yes stop_codon:yes gene_type:complete
LKNTPSQSYWKSNIRILISLLAIWFIASFGFGIIWSDALDNIQVGGFKLGFWFAQQGSIYIFVLLIFIYITLMNRLDKKYQEEVSQDLDKK